jgi:hypothetical protein
VSGYPILAIDDGGAVHEIPGEYLGRAFRSGNITPASQLSTKGES